MARLIWIGIVLALATVGGGAWRNAEQQAPSAYTAFVNVTALPMHTSASQPGWTVIVGGGRIVGTGPTATTAVPPAATVIEGRGKFLIPGLTEMHGHIPAPTSAPGFIEDVLFLYVANGVTTVRGMQGTDGQLALRARAAKGEIVAPTLYLAGPAFSGGAVGTPEAAVARVKQQKAEGWDLLKVQTGLSLETYDAMAQTARDLNIPFAGHVPAAVGVERAMAARQSTIDHMDGMIELLNGQTAPVTDAALADLAAKTKRAGTGIVPTLYVWETLRGGPTLESRTSLPELKYLPRQMVEQWTTQLANRLKNPQFNAAGARQYIANRARLLQALHEAGVEILLGSDAPQQFNVPGFSLHREIAAMAAAGMKPYDILRTGTAGIGEFVHNEDSFGSIAVGHRADFVLLDANPLVDLANLTRRSGVMLRGRWIPESDIQKRLAEIASRNAN